MKLAFTGAINSKLLKPSAAAELFSWTVAETLKNGLKFSVKQSEVKVVTNVNDFVRIPSSLSRDIKSIGNEKSWTRKNDCIDAKLHKDCLRKFRKVYIRQLLNWFHRKKRAIIPRQEFYKSETEYRTDFWKFSKKLFEEEVTKHSALSKESTEAYFKNTCSTAREADVDTGWWEKFVKPQVKPLDETPIRPKDVHSALK